jgi:hypothetical protein
MTPRKPWTVMVYLAADNNLTNFGIANLQQMKAVCGDAVNIVAEFHSGPQLPTKRYLFDHGTVTGSLKQNELCVSGAANAGDPANLTAFIEWAATHYEADHYYLIIWGHGGGCDDDFPRVADRSFVQRHRLLNSGKGVRDEGAKGFRDEPAKGVRDEGSKGVLDEPRKGVLNDFRQNLNDALKGAHLAQLKKTGRLDIRQEDRGALEQEILSALQQGINNVFHSRVFDDVRKHMFAALDTAFPNAVRMGILDDLQKKLVDAYSHGGPQALENLITTEDHSDMLDGLFRQVINALHDGVLGISQQNVLPLIKSLAFVDHPQSYLTNKGLKKSLQDGCKFIKNGKGKIDIVGMDACEMNMVEIGYEIRESANFLVASQDGIPDASWPYDQILRQLVGSPNILPRDLACLTATTYVYSYQEYLDQPVTLSVMNLDDSERMVSLFKKFTEELKRSKTDPGLRRAIVSARRLTRSFGQNQFADIVHFCQLLAETQGSRDLGTAALEFSAQFKSFIASKEASNDELNCNGTSVYFPEYDPARYDHQKRLAKLYGELDFAHHTKWDEFLTELLEEQKGEDDWITSQIKGKQLEGSAHSLSPHNDGTNGVTPLRKHNEKTQDAPDMQ